MSTETIAVNTTYGDLYYIALAGADVFQILAVCKKLQKAVEHASNYATKYNQTAFVAEVRLLSEVTSMPNIRCLRPKKPGRLTVIEGSKP